MRVAINKVRSTKAPGYDLITGEILKKLPEVGLSAITYIYNSILCTGYFPGQWKVSQIVTILKPGKPAEDVKSYRPISLLAILSKVFEKLFITRIQPILHTIYTNNTGPPIWIQKKTLQRRASTSHHQYNSQGTGKQTILHCGLPRYQSGLWQSMAWRITV